jgi:protease I
MNQTLQGVRVAILVADGFEQEELLEPRKALQEAGAQTTVVSPASGKVKGWNHTEWGDTVPVEVPLQQATPEQFDALLLPGGVMNPDKLRRESKALSFVKAFFDQRKPVAVICHGAWTLIEAGVVRGRRMTSYSSIKTDLVNAGAQWDDREVVIDQRLISSRKPDDIPAFNRTIVDEFAKAHRESRAAA